jgi:hypothetical protein
MQGWWWQQWLDRYSAGKEGGGFVLLVAPPAKGRTSSGIVGTMKTHRARGGGEVVVLICFAKMGLKNKQHEVGQLRGAHHFSQALPSTRPVA